MAVTTPFRAGLSEARLRDIPADIRAKAHVLYGDDSVGCLIRAFAADGTSAVILFRVTQVLARWHLAPAAWFVMKLNKLLNGVMIGLGARIARGFAIQHSVGVVINRGAVIGTGCVVESGVVIGAINRRSPEIGNDVYIGSGAKVIGGVRIGDGCKIGANAVVVNDIPAGATAVGIPARVI